jgi:hypothetical protein
MTAMAAPSAAEQCADECARCFELCTETVTRCLELGGRHAEALHVTLLLDCAEACRTAEGFLRRGSDRHPLLCRACAGICRSCAADCERMADGDLLMHACAVQCRRCASACEAMAA